jgi:glutamate racemase
MDPLPIGNQMSETGVANPIGVFDSGVGGLTVLLEIQRLLPAEDILYLADQAHLPYGNRSDAEILKFSSEISRFLMEHHAKLIVVACNSISAAALKSLRSTYPGIPFVGMEPAVKPAALSSENGVVGVLATPNTLRGELFNRTSARYAGGIELIPVTFEGLVQKIEAGELETTETNSILRSGLEPCLAAGADTLVLACTHYPLVLNVLREIVGPGVQIIDPAPAIAKQVQKVLGEMDLLIIPREPGEIILMSTDGAQNLAIQAEKLLGIKGLPVELNWENLRLTKID